MVLNQQMVDILRQQGVLGQQGLPGMFGSGGGDQFFQQFGPTGFPSPSNRQINRAVRGAGGAAAQEALGTEFFQGPTAGQGNVLEQLRAFQGSGDPRLQAFMAQAGGFGQNLGLATQAFDPARIAAFRSDIESNVVDPLRAEFERGRQLTQRDIQQRATQAGAFGGSRSAISQAVADVESRRGEATAIGQARNLAEMQAREAALQEFQGIGGRALGAGTAQMQSLLGGLQLGGQLDLSRIGGLAGLEEQMRALQERGGLNEFERRRQALNLLQQTQGTMDLRGMMAGGGGGGIGGALGSGIGGGIAAAGLGLGPIGIGAGALGGILSGLL